MLSFLFLSFASWQRSYMARFSTKGVLEQKTENDEIYQKSASIDLRLKLFLCFFWHLKIPLAVYNLFC